MNYWHWLIAAAVILINLKGMFLFLDVYLFTSRMLKGKHIRQVILNDISS